MTDRLQQVKSRPLIVEDAVRTALRDSIAWRIGGGGAPNADAFVSAAVASARLTLDAADCNTAERSNVLAAAHHVSTRFTRTALYRRLMKVPAAKFLRLPRALHGADVIVRGRDGRLHAIALTAGVDALEAGQVATRVAAATPLGVADRLTPLTVHVFSLATADRRSFEREVDNKPSRRLIVARVA